MIKAPGKEDIKRNGERWNKIHQILRADARKQLENNVLIPSKKRLLELLIAQKDFVGDIATWCPSQTAKDKLNVFIESEFVHGDFDEDEIKPWFADQISGLILKGEISKLAEIFYCIFPLVIESLDPELKNRENVFYKFGDVWLVKFKGKSKILLARKRLSFIVYLLSKKYHSFYAHELDQLVGKAMPNSEYSKMSDNGTLGAITGISLKDLHTDKYNEEDIESLENVVTNVWDDLKKAESKGNPKEIKSKQEKWSEAKRFMLNEYGIKVHGYKNNLSFSYKPKLEKDAEKRRQSVSQNIKKALQDIKKELPALYLHLKAEKCIQTGKKCSYHPKPASVNWYIRW